MIESMKNNLEIGFLPDDEFNIIFVDDKCHVILSVQVCIKTCCYK